MKTFYSNGKLLLTSEYLVLDGALALAIPTRFGQSLTVKELNESKLIWKSLDQNGAVWFESETSLENITPDSSNMPGMTNEISTRLLQLLTAAKKLNPNFLNTGYEVTTALNFPRNWGLGTSSTLVYNLAQWAQVDAYELLDLTFGGSGYDLACAQNSTPITYQLGTERQVNQVDFNPSFKAHLYFVYLNRKQNSRESISTYKKKTVSTKDIEKATQLTKDIINSKELDSFCALINAHENLISNLLNLAPVKQQLFPDFKGSIKSLGGWGGDFVLVASQDNPRSYFESKGYKTVIPYQEMVLN